MPTPASNLRVHPGRAARWHSLTAILWLTATGCGNKTEAGSETYASHVAELIYSSCTPCHRPGETTPFALLDYADVYKRRNQIVEVTGDRLMPPWRPGALSGLPASR